MLPRVERPLTAAALTLLIAALACTGGAQDAVLFRTPDGTRVWLLPQAGPRLIHWAVATPCGPQVDPLSAPGLAAAVAKASLRGTWRTGSRDAQKEQTTLAELDAAEMDLQLLPRVGTGSNAELADRAAALRTAAEALADPKGFRRVLLAAPAQDLELDVHGDVAILSLTTTPFAVPTIARLLRERREEAALRGWRQDLMRWRDRATETWDQAPLAPLYAELLALTFPGHPLARAGDRPATAGTPRALAVATWQKSQHPANTVHVLLGNFDAAAARTALLEAFAATALPLPEPLVRASPRAQPALRRSLVPGARYPAAVLAFALTADMDPTAVAAAARWFAAGPGSFLAQEFARAGLPTVEVAVRAPWPEGAGPGLLTIEVADPAGGAANLADEVLRRCAAAVPKQARTEDLAAAYGSVLREFEAATQRPAAMAGWFAARLLRLPDAPPPTPPPQSAPLPELPQLLQRILDGHPIVVEWRDA